MGTVRCKAKGCRFKPADNLEFCSKCQKKLNKGLLLEDGRLKKDVCRAITCSRSEKSEGWCAICFKKYKKGYFNSDGRLSSKAELELQEKVRREKRREKNRAKREAEIKKKTLREKISLPIIKEYRDAKPEIGESFGCPRLKIFIDPATCMHRLFVKGNRECKGCDLHNNLVDDFLNFINESGSDDEVVL